MVHLEAENGKEQIYFHRDNTLIECVICVKKCELEQMITNFLIWGAGKLVNKPMLTIFL